MIACGAAALTARVSALASNTSTTTGSAPSRCSASALSALRVVPATWWPAARKSGVNRRPMAPPAPARNIFTPAESGLRQRIGPVCVRALLAGPDEDQNQGREEHQAGD